MGSVGQGKEHSNRARREDLCKIGRSPNGGFRSGESYEWCESESLAQASQALGLKEAEGRSRLVNVMHGLRFKRGKVSLRPGQCLV